MEITIPATMPPAVSIEKDFPGRKPLCLPASTSLTKVKPEAAQKGNSTSRDRIRLEMNEGVSPGFKHNRESRNRRARVTSGLSTNIRLIFPVSERVDLAASDEPLAEAISHVPRKVPAISSYPLRCSWVPSEAEAGKRNLWNPVKTDLRQYLIL